MPDTEIVQSGELIALIVSAIVALAIKILRHYQKTALADAIQDLAPAIERLAPLAVSAVDELRKTQTIPNALAKQIAMEALRSAIPEADRAKLKPLELANRTSDAIEDAVLKRKAGADLPRAIGIEATTTAKEIGAALRISAPKVGVVLGASGKPGSGTESTKATAGIEWRF